MSSFKKSIISGTIWSVIGQFATLLIILISNIILARILSPREFGQIGIIMFFIMLANAFSEGGLSGALIRKKNVTKIDYSTVFVFNFLVSIFCFFLLILFSDKIANYYKDNSLSNLLIVSGFVLIINAFQITQNAKLMIDMKFKKKTLYRFFSVLIATIIGLFFAYSGYGVWSLVFIQLLISLNMTLILWFFEGINLGLKFDKNSFKELYGFGVNTTIASLLNTAFDNVYQLILAKYFSLNETGFYYQAKKLQEVPTGVINMIAQSVVFSSLSKLQDDKTSFINAYNKIFLYFSIILGFITVLTYVYAEQIIIILYGDKWIQSVIYMQFLSVASFFYVQEQINRVIFKVFNETRKILYLEILKKIIQLLCIFVGLYYLDIKVLIGGFIFTNIIGYLLNSIYSSEILNSKLKHELLKVIKISLVSFLCIIITIYLSTFMSLTGYMNFLTFPLVLFLYVIGIQFFKIFDFKVEIKNLINLYR